MEDATENLDFFLSGKIIIFKTFYYRGKQQQTDGYNKTTRDTGGK